MARAIRLSYQNGVDLVSSFFSVRSSVTKVSQLLLCARYVSTIYYTLNTKVLVLHRSVLLRSWFGEVNAPECEAEDDLEDC